MWCWGSIRASISVSDSPFVPVAPFARWSEPMISAVIGPWVGGTEPSSFEVFLSLGASTVIRPRSARTFFTS